MIRLIIYAVLIYVIYRLVKGLFGPSKELEKGTQTGVIDEMVQDPFCKTYIPRREALRRVIDGQEHFFAARPAPINSRRARSPRIAADT